MAIMLILFTSLALVALIGAALVYIVARLTEWTVARIDSRDADHFSSAFAWVPRRSHEAATRADAAARVDSAA